MLPTLTTLSQSLRLPTLFEPMKKTSNKSGILLQFESTETNLSVLFGQQQQQLACVNVLLYIALDCTAAITTATAVFSYTQCRGCQSFTKGKILQFFPIASNTVAQNFEMQKQNVNKFTQFGASQILQNYLVLKLKKLIHSLDSLQNSIQSCFMRTNV